MNAPNPSRTTLASITAKKAAADPIVMVTAYDYPTAQIVDTAGVDIVLVGDSGAMTVLGHPDTVALTVDEIRIFAAAVRRGTSNALVVVDLPFGSYEASDGQAVRTALDLIKTTRCDAVKIERGGRSIERARAIVDAGVPVMGHLGLTPQTATALSGFRVQGRTAEAALALRQDAGSLVKAGCFALVLEAVPESVAAVITADLPVPVIGIGAGAGTDGQVLVFHDLVGLYHGPSPKFVRQYADVRSTMTDAVVAYAGEVRDRLFPTQTHTYGMPAAELERFHASLDSGG